MALSPGKIAWAQTNDSRIGQALEIAPPVAILKADPGQTVTAKINLRNVAKGKLVVTNEINDFTSGGETGNPKVDLENKEPGPYSIRNWISPIPTMTLEQKQVKVINLSINVPANASPGGYYGIIRFTAAPPELDDTGVSLSASLGELVFLRVNGDAKESMSIESFSTSNPNTKKTDWLFESSPIQFDVRLKNTGNVFEQPVGKIVVSDMFGKQVANVNVNLQKNYVLPQSIRKFSQLLNSEVLGNRWLFGKYTADLTVTYGEKSQTITKQLSFWVIPYKLIAVIIIALIGLFIVLYFLIKRYNRFVVKRAQGSKSRHR